MSLAVQTNDKSTIIRDNNLPEQSKKGLKIIDQRVDATGNLVVTCTTQVTPKELSDLRINQLFAQKAEATKNMGMISPILLVASAFFPPLLIPGGLLFIKELASMGEKFEANKVARKLELQIDAEQAFADSRPQDLHRDDMRAKFINDYIKAHESDAECYTDCDGISVSYFDERQSARHKALYPSAGCYQYSGM